MIYFVLVNASKPIGTSCMKFLRADTDLRAKTKLKTIRKPCGCIDIDTGSIHFI